MSNSDKKEACAPSPSLTENDVLEATRSLLESIVAQDWETYTSLVDASISCFEPEAIGNLVEGLEFHKFYFNNENKTNDSTSNYSSSSSSNRKRVNNTTMVRPHVRILAGGNAAVVSYVRLTQQQVVIGGGASNIDNSGPQQQQQQVTTETRACEETRVWERNATTGMLLNVHFHRSTIG
jgi:calcium/calmodulin-dependent protein kinase (CaM kinase) II